MDAKQSTAVAVAAPQTASALPVQNMSDLAVAGQLLAQDGFLGARSQGDGFLIAGACHQSKLSLVEFQQKFHYRQGRFSMQAHAILAVFCERGGKYKLLERSPTRAAIELNKNGNVYLSELTWEDAAQEPFVYRGNEDQQLAELDKPVAQRRLKAKYKTPRSRMQMLWARVISDGVAVLDPGARSAYTPEETDDIIDAEYTSAPRKELTPDEAARRAKPVDATIAEPFAVVDALGPEHFCPVGGEDVQGQPWTAFETEVLVSALECEDDAITTAHRECIRAEIARREGGGE
jgi:hypothetical protein